MGLFVASDELPNYEIPRFDAIGANEFIIDVAHEAADFTSGAEFSPVAELNIWYHVLNCGFRVAMLGETDFPCISSERVGTGRTYVGPANPPIGDLGYGSWIEGIRNGRLYFGDGRSHFIHYQINGHHVGTGNIELPIPATVVVTPKIAARLEEKANPKVTAGGLASRTCANPRNAQCNGRSSSQRSAVAQKTISASGELVAFWDRDQDSAQLLGGVANTPLRTHPSDLRSRWRKPVRRSRRSAEWCLTCIDAVWQRNPLK